MDRDALTYHYQWSQNGTPVAGASGATYTLAGVPGGTVVGVTVSADDGHGGTTGPVSANATVSANNPPVAGTVTISPSSPTAGATLTVAPSGFSDSDGDALTYTYAWFRNGAQLAGATGPTLAGANVQEGDVIRVEVRASDGHGGTSAAATASVTVSSLDTIAPTINITSPVATVTYRRGQMLVVRFVCSDSGSGVASCTATLTRAGSSTRTVTSGQSVQLQKGSYTFKVSARDRAGNTAAKTVNFTVR